MKTTVPEIKGLIEELKDEDNLTVTRKRQILAIIEDRVGEVWAKICKLTDANMQWWSFSNDDGSDGGEFDVRMYGEFISLFGEWGDNAFHDGFPTEYLWREDYEDLINIETEKYELEQAEKQKKKKDYAKRAKEKKVIIDKLKKMPLEELKELYDSLQA